MHILAKLSLHNRLSLIEYPDLTADSGLAITNRPIRTWQAMLATTNQLSERHSQYHVLRMADVFASEGKSIAKMDSEQNK